MGDTLCDVCSRASATGALRTHAAARTWRWLLTCPGRKLLSTHGKPMAEASAMVPGPAFVTKRSEEIMYCWWRRYKEQCVKVQGASGAEHQLQDGRARELPFAFTPEDHQTNPRPYCCFSPGPCC